MKRIADILLRPTHTKRFLFFGITDLVTFTASLYLSFALRFDFHLGVKELDLVLSALPLFLAVKLIVFVLYRVYHITWRFFGLSDLNRIMNALVVSEVLLIALILVPDNRYTTYLSPSGIAGFPRSIFIIDGAVSLLLVGAVRLMKRVYLQLILKSGTNRGKRTIIIGAGSTGELILRDMVQKGYEAFYPVAFLDDNAEQHGTYLHGVQVMGGTDELSAVVVTQQAAAVIVAIPHLDHKRLRAVYDAAKAAGVKNIKIIPPIYNVDKPNIDLKALEDISIEDLIGRPDVQIDYGEVAGLVRGKKVLITGAGGSIGSEIVLQVCAFEPKQIVLLDADETEMHSMDLRLRRLYPQYFDGDGENNRVSCVIGDIRDEALVNGLFESIRPDIVFHAAAYKHVPILESNCNEAVKVNIFGTRNLVKAAGLHGTAKFVMISTDKAVRPTSIMGATKRIAEYICKTGNGHGGIEFVSVRFGNVLGSRGSVLPLFLEQLKRGGPLTVTHPDMRRYFMTIHEAVLLVLQASVIGKGGDVMVLDMGEPVRITDLAEELIRMHGFTPGRDIDISFVGIRPGEKLFEEILTAEEGTVASRHKKIFVARDSANFTPGDIEAMLGEFRESLAQPPVTGCSKRISGLLRKYVPHYEEMN